MSDFARGGIVAPPPGDGGDSVPAFLSGCDYVIPAHLSAQLAELADDRQGRRMKPTVGRIVHYVSYGTPGGEYKSECRAAVVTAGPHFVSGTFSEGGGEAVSLCVLNPEGMFFNKSVLYHEGDTGHDHAGDEIAERSYRGGSWHWPEREG